MHFLQLALLAVSAVGVIANPAEEVADVDEAGPRGGGRPSLPKIGGGHGPSLPKIGGGRPSLPKIGGGRGPSLPKIGGGGRGPSFPKIGGGGNRGGNRPSFPKPSFPHFGGNGGNRGGPRPHPVGGFFPGHGHGGGRGGRWGYGYQGPHFGWDNIAFTPIVVPLPVPLFGGSPTPPSTYLADGSSCTTSDPDQCNSGMCCALNTGEGDYCLTDQDVESGDQCYIVQQ